MTRHHLSRLPLPTLTAFALLASTSACSDDTAEADDDIGETAGTDSDSSSSTAASETSATDSSSTTDDTETSESETSDAETSESETGTEDTETESSESDTGEPVDPIDPATATPVSGMVAVTLEPDVQGADIPTYIKALVALVDADMLPADVEFPLAADTTDTVRVAPGLRQSVVAKWFDPLTTDDGPEAPRYGANNDYIAYFGDGWTGAPQFSGSGSSGWIWTNHEYISGDQPTAMTGPSGQFSLLTQFLHWAGEIDDPAAEIWSEGELSTVISEHKRQVGGSWFRVLQDTRTGQWLVNQSAPNRRYDATSATQVLVTGIALSGVAHDDQGTELPAGVVPGIMGDCSGAQTPWGTIITAEENVQSYYGDVEPCWTSQQQLVVDSGCDPGADITLTSDPNDDGAFGSHPDPNQRHNRDFYGFLVEIDPGQAPDEYYGKTTPGDGHQKLGALGRARWENATFAVGPDWQLVDGQPVVLYAANDRRGGRIYKFVTSAPYSAGMSKAEIRDLLGAGAVYVAHFGDLDNDQGLTVGGAFPGPLSQAKGRWIELSTTSMDVAPNAPALGADTRVGEALVDQSWNGLAGFPNDDTVRRALWTASTKIGVMELNRPEDLEFNPADGMVYIAFTKHGRRVALDEQGVLYDPETQEMDSPVREDSTGAVFVMDEAGDPATSTQFTFWAAWTGTEGADVYDAANPDNLFIDAQGGVWFGTDGNYGVNGHADALYYLDLDPDHLNTFGKAFRVAAGPSDSEATGPALSSDSRTLFFNVQHPGESQRSTWPG